jgi:predicted dehydrogenase
MTDPLDRRQFVRHAGASLAAARGAGEKIGVGLIGFGLIGKRHVLSFKAQKDVRLVALAEAHRGRLEEGAAFMGGRVRKYADFRRLLDDRDVDAVVVATPDHWHALMTMLACAAGKDVYVEKPVTLFPREGRWMLALARRHGRVVQVGTQQRSGEHYARAKELIRGGHIGRVVSVRMHAYRNVMPGFGRPPDGEPPAGLDWELFLGPAPWRKYNRNRGLYHFRWFWDTSGGQMTNLGHHSLDVLDWVMGGRWPRSVASAGGRYCLLDNGETPDTQDALFDFGAFTALWSHREAARGEPARWSLEFFGDKGSLSLSRKGFLVTPDDQLPPAAAIPTFAGAHPVGGPAARPLLGPPRPRTREVEDLSGNTDRQFLAHARNFLDCVRSRRQPVSDLQSGQRVSTICHLANIALRLGRQVRWDEKRETIPGDAEAAALLERPYRPPWDRERKRLLEGTKP